MDDECLAGHTRASSPPLESVIRITSMVILERAVRFDICTGFSFIEVRRGLVHSLSHCSMLLMYRSVFERVHLGLRELRRRNTAIVAILVEKDILAFSLNIRAGLDPLALSGCHPHLSDKVPESTDLLTVVLAQDWFDGI